MKPVIRQIRVALYRQSSIIKSELIDWSISANASVFIASAVYTKSQLLANGYVKEKLYEVG